MALIARSLLGSSKIHADETCMVLADHVEELGLGYLAGILRGNESPDWMLELLRRGPSAQSLAIGTEYVVEGESRFPAMTLMRLQWDFPMDDIDELSTVRVMQRSGTIEMHADFIGRLY